ncbi:MAG: outer membrane lipid asymmetry maintenance protein MlaD [Candidatus Binatia bacterium]
MDEAGTRDFVIGLFVLIGLVALAYLSFSVGGIGYTGHGGTPLYATFDQVADLKVRAPVQISGVPVGRVVGISLDKSYRARVDVEIDDKIELPVDTSAAVVTSGLLGDRYIALEIGAEDAYLEAGEEIAYTESALVLERIVGKFLYNFSNEKE